MSDSGATNDPPSSSRRNRPCDACRRRKSRCVLEKGSKVCVLCRFHDQACTYKEAPAPRKRLGAVGVGESEYSATLARRRKVRSKPGSSGVEEYDALPGPSLLKRTLGLQKRHHTHYCGSNAIASDQYPNIDRAVDENTAFDDDDTPDGVLIRFIHPDHSFRIIPDDMVPLPTDITTLCDRIEEATLGHGAKLVQLYFRIIHPSFPVLHKNVFLEKYARSHREFNPPLLAAVYLLAIGYWNFDEELIAFPKPNVHVFESIAFSSFHEAMMRPKLSAVQGGLLLTQYQTVMPDGDLDERYIHLTTQLVSLMYTLGLHIDCGDWKIPDWEIGLRRRISWAVFMQDRSSAIFDARPCLINQENWGVLPLTSEDFPENEEDDQDGSSEVAKGAIVFMRMAELSAILSQCHSNVFSIRSRAIIEKAPDRLGTFMQRTYDRKTSFALCRSAHAARTERYRFGYIRHDDIQSLINRPGIEPTKAALWDWYVSQPEMLKMDATPSTKLSAVGYLHFAYIGIEILMNRQLLRAMMLTTNPDSHTVQNCRITAKKWFTDAVGFVQQLQAKHLTSFWYYTSSSTCVMIYDIGRILASCATDMNDRAECMQKLREFKWALKVNSEAGASFCRRGLTLINYLSKMGSQGCMEDANRTSSPGSAPLSHSGTTPEQSQHQQHPYQTYQPWMTGVDPYTGTWTGEGMVPPTSGYAPEMGMFGPPPLDPMQGQIDGPHAWMSGMHHP